MRIKIKRAAGIEPASSAWKAEVLPLNYARDRTKALLTFGVKVNSLPPLLPCESHYPKKSE